MRNVSNEASNHIDGGQSWATITKIKHSNRANGFEKLEERHDLPISQYDIIPLTLISRFFEVWSNSFSTMSNFYECINSAHLKFFNDKLLSYNILKTRQNEINDNNIYHFVINHTNINDLKRHWFSSDTGGNFFSVPENRIPSSPRFIQRDVGSMLSFDFDSAPIVGQEHYEEMLSLFKRLIDYVGTNPDDATPFERYILGVELYFSMMTTFASYRTHHFDLSQWEERAMTEEELSRFSEEERDNYRGKLYWAVKKNFKRSRRSVSRNEEKCYLMKQLSKKRWSEFVVYIMNAFLDSESYGEDILWANDFARLYIKSRSELSTKTNGNCLTNELDTFLYSKISRMQEWYDCISFKDTKDPNKWCQAWRRIMLNSNIGSGNTEKKMRPKQFYRDVKILVNWLKNIVIDKQKARSTDKKLSELNKKSRVFICYRNTLSLACRNDCKNTKTSGNEIPTLDANNLYARKWTLGNDNIMKCECSDYHTPESSGSIFSGLKNLWNSLLSNPCARNSPNYKLPRCTDLR